MLIFRAKTGFKCRSKRISSAVQLGKLCQCVSKAAIALLLLVTPAAANDLTILNNSEEVEGGLTEFANPDGVSCRYREPSRPSLSFGAGLSRGPVLQESIAIGEGQIGFNRTDSFTNTRAGDLQPVVGIALRIPFGGPGSRNCDNFLIIEDAMIRYTKAQELFELGVITQDQLEEIASKAFAVLNDF